MATINAKQIAVTCGDSDADELPWIYVVNGDGFVYFYDDINTGKWKRLSIEIAGDNE